MSEIVLHHYEMSPFGTVIRLALGLKGLQWKSVEAPVISPKPDLSALTGGYERIPVLQMGADIYCDTDCITEALEERYPQPSLYPDPLGPAGKMIALWSGGAWFMPTVGASIGVNPDALPEEFWEDRGKRFGMRRETFLPAVPHLKSQFAGGARVVMSALDDGRAFIAGDHAGHADFALYMNIRFVALAGMTPADFSPQLAAWYERVEAIGYGDFEDWTGEQAIEHAQQSEPVGGCAVESGEDFSAGQRVSVTTDSPDPATIEGKLVGLSDRRISLSRSDERAGEVHVHFPRLGQIMTSVD